MKVHSTARHKQAKILHTESPTSVSHHHESTQHSKTHVGQNTTHWASTKCLHHHESTQHSKTCVVQNTTPWASTKWLASQWKYTAQQDSCRSKYYMLCIHRVTLHHWHSKTLRKYQKISIVHTVSTKRLTIHPEAGKLQYYTLCPPSDLQYTPKQENLNATHSASTNQLTIHPKARKPQYYTLCVHQVTYNSINTPQSRKTTMLQTVRPPSNLHHVGRRGEAKLAWLCSVRWGPPPADGESVHTHTNSQNLSTHKQFTESVHTHKNS